MRILIFGLVGVGAVLTSAGVGLAADMAVVPATPVIVASDAPRPPAPRRYLTSYMAKYPFGVLREDYTPLGAPGVSKTAYFGVPRLYATLNVPPRRWAQKQRRHRGRVIVSAAY